MFAGLRLGLHVLFASLILFVVARTIFTESRYPAVILGLLGILTVVYAVGLVFARQLSAPVRPLAGRIWLLCLTGVWFVLVWFAPDAAYLAFPMSFLYLHLFPRVAAVFGVLLTAFLAIVGLAFHHGLNLGGVIGPLVGAAVAILMGFGYESLSREALARESLLAELLATERELASSQREAGVLAERARLAREIHDTVAQGLSGIQILLHAAERADPDGPSIKHVQLARETAASTLSEARRFIRELTPAALENQGLAAALGRLPATSWVPDSLEVTVDVSDCSHVPMPIQTAVLRIAQGALANVVQHAQASRASIEVSSSADVIIMRVSDDGRGFDLDNVAVASPHEGNTSFGLAAAQERVNQLDGTLTITTSLGHGTTLEISIPLTDTEDS